MKKLNQKGITVLEIIVSFTIVSIIVIGLLKSISSYGEKATIATEKKEITTFKNTATKYIMDSIISIGGVDKWSVGDENNAKTISVENGYAGGRGVKLWISIDDNKKKLQIQVAKYDNGINNNYTNQYDNIKKYKYVASKGIKVSEPTIITEGEFLHIRIELKTNDALDGHKLLDLIIPNQVSNRLITQSHDIEDYVNSSIENSFENYDNICVEDSINNPSGMSDFCLYKCTTRNDVEDSQAIETQTRFCISEYSENTLLVGNNVYVLPNGHVLGHKEESYHYDADEDACKYKYTLYTDSGYKLIDIDLPTPDRKRCT